MTRADLLAVLLRRHLLCSGCKCGSLLPGGWMSPGRMLALVAVMSLCGCVMVIGRVFGTHVGTFKGVLAPCWAPCSSEVSDLVGSHVAGLCPAW
jgi:hypothetical protein